MTSFKPIPPRSAIDLFAESGIDEGIGLIASLAEANLVKAYARMTETVGADGSRESVRDKRVAPDIWRRIIADGKVSDVLSGTVRLDASAEFGGGPKISLIGIRFDPQSLEKAAAEHGHLKPRTPAPVPLKAVEKGEGSEDMTALPPSPARRRPAISENAEYVTVDEALEIMRIGRTKIYELIGNGDLQVVKIGRATRIERKSIDELLKR